VTFKTKKEKDEAIAEEIKHPTSAKHLQDLKNASVEED
jgi:hypothetical protein